MSDEQKVLDFNKPVHYLVNKYPEIAPIMAELGFDNILKPGMLATVGRFVTIPKGAKMKGIDLERVKRAFVEKGFIIEEK